MNARNSIAKPHKCDICDLAFSQSERLRIHKRSYMGDNSFKCDICEKTFSLIGNLNRHKRIHSRKKPLGI